MHSADERIDVRDLGFATELLRRPRPRAARLSGSSKAPASSAGPAATSIARARPRRRRPAQRARRTPTRSGPAIAKPERQQRQRSHPVIGADARQRVRRDVARQGRLPEDHEQRAAEAGGDRQRTTTASSGAPSAKTMLLDGPRKVEQQPDHQRARRPPADRQHRPAHGAASGDALEHAEHADAARRAPWRSPAPAHTTGRSRTAPRPAKAAIVTHTQGRERTSRQPARSSCRRRRRRARVSPRGRGWTRRAAAALTTNVAASSANASPAPTPAPARSRAQGRQERDVGVDLASARGRPGSASSGMVCGSRPVYAGWKKARAAPNSSLDHDHLDDRRAAASGSGRPARACRPARARSVAIMIRWRGQAVGPHAAEQHAARPAARDCAASTRPRSVAEPVRCVMYSASATITTWSPTALAD